MYDAIEEYDLELDGDQLNVDIADFKRKHGECRYNGTEPNGPCVEGQYCIRIARALLEGKADLENTTLHELAHAESHERYGYEYDSKGNMIHHGDSFKSICREVEIPPERCANEMHTEHYEYYVACPKCGWENGKFRMCTSVRNEGRICSECRTKIVSYDAGKERPEEPGTTDVDRLA